MLLTRAAIDRRLFERTEMTIGNDDRDVLDVAIIGAGFSASLPPAR